MKINVGSCFFLAAVFIAIVIISLSRSGSSPSSSPTTSASSADSSSSQTQAVVDDNRPVTIVAMYQDMGSTMVLNSNNKGVISGSCFGAKSHFNWEDKGTTIELTNWDWAEADGRVGVCKKLTDVDAVNIIWTSRGYSQYTRLYKIAIE